MTVQIIRGPLVDAPTPDKRSGGLLDVAEIRAGVAWMDGVDMFTSWNCIDTSNTDVCATDQTPTKTFTAPTVVDGTRFVLYLGGKCKPLSAEVETSISRVFDLRESKGVEAQFQADVLSTGTALTGATSVETALAIMEEALANGYAGVGTIHLPVRIASLLAADKAIVEENGQWYTRLGTKVVIGAGYTGLNMWGTGDVVVYAGPKQVTDAPDTANNEVNVLAERVYVVVADCVTYQITGIALTSSPSDPGEPEPDVNLDTGTVVLSGPGDSWMPPANLRSVTVTVTNGSLLVDGSEVTAPHSVTFDADEGETLDPPDVQAIDTGDFGVVSWVVVVP